MPDHPGAEAMSLKLLFEPGTGKLLGAQGVGGAGVDKRIDVLAVAIQAGMTVFDLEEMELCYAPQFGSAKDPINMLGFVGAGLVRGDHPQIGWETVDQTTLKAMLLDVRTPTEFGNGHIPALSTSRWMACVTDWLNSTRANRLSSIARLVSEVTWPLEYSLAIGLSGYESQRRV